MIEQFEVIPFNELAIHSNFNPDVAGSGKSNDNTLLYITLGCLAIVSAVVIYNIIKIHQSKRKLEVHD